MPNYTAAVKMLINGVARRPPFSMQLPPLMAEPNPELSAALAKLSASRYGRPRAQVEGQRSSDAGRQSKQPRPRKPANSGSDTKTNSAVEWR